MKILFLIILIVVMPSMALAQEYTPLVGGIPGINDAVRRDGSMGEYINALYITAISIAAFLAVIKIIFAGVQYMLSDIVTSKEKAKKDIQGALLGLLIVLGAVVILNTINPSLTNLDALGEAPSIDFDNDGRGGFGRGLTGTNSIDLENTNDESVRSFIENCIAQEGFSYTERVDTSITRGDYATGVCTLDAVSELGTNYTYLDRETCLSNEGRYRGNGACIMNVENCLAISGESISGECFLPINTTSDTEILDQEGNLIQSDQVYNFECSNDIDCASFCLRFGGNLQDPEGPNYGQCSDSTVNIPG